MADLEGPPEKKPRLFFGSLENEERRRLDESGENGGLSAAVLAGIKAGNINIADGEL